MKIEDIREKEDIYVYDYDYKEYKLCLVKKILKTKIKLYSYDTKKERSIEISMIEKDVKSKLDFVKYTHRKQVISKFNTLAKNVVTYNTSVIENIIFLIEEAIK